MSPKLEVDTWSFHPCQNDLLASGVPPDAWRGCGYAWLGNTFHLPVCGLVQFSFFRLLAFCMYIYSRAQTHNGCPQGRGLCAPSRTGSLGLSQGLCYSLSWAQSLHVDNGEIRLTGL